MAFGGNRYHFSVEGHSSTTAAAGQTACQSYVDAIANTGYNLFEIRSMEEMEFVVDVARALVHMGERSKDIGYFLGIITYVIIVITHLC